MRGVIKRSSKYESLTEKKISNWIDPCFPITFRNKVNIFTYSPEIMRVQYLGRVWYELVMEKPGFLHSQLLQSFDIWMIFQY